MTTSDWIAMISIFTGVIIYFLQKEQQKAKIKMIVKKTVQNIPLNPTSLVYQVIFVNIGTKPTTITDLYIVDNYNVNRSLKNT